MHAFHTSARSVALMPSRTMPQKKKAIIIIYAISGEMCPSDTEVNEDSGADWTRNIPQRNGIEPIKAKRLGSSGRG